MILDLLFVQSSVIRYRNRLEWFLFPHLIIASSFFTIFFLYYLLFSLSLVLPHLPYSSSFLPTSLPFLLLSFLSQPFSAPNHPIVFNDDRGNLETPNRRTWWYARKTASTSHQNFAVEGASSHRCKWLPGGFPKFCNSICAISATTAFLPELFSIYNHVHGVVIPRRRKMSPVSSIEDLAEGEINQANHSNITETKGVIISLTLKLMVRRMGLYSPIRIVGRTMKRKTSWKGKRRKQLPREAAKTIRIPRNSSTTPLVGRRRRWSVKLLPWRSNHRAMAPLQWKPHRSPNHKLNHRLKFRKSQRLMRRTL